jgi:hypothetical protein
LAAFAPFYAEAANLLQAQFAPRRASESVRRGSWRWPLRLAIAVVALQLAGFASEAWRLHRSADAVGAQLIAAARPLQPTIDDPEAALRLLRDRLSSWSQGGVDPVTAPVLAPLAQLAQAKAAATSVQVLSLATDTEGRVRTQLSAMDEAGLTTATGVLAASGWTPSDLDAAIPAAASDTDPGPHTAIWRSPPRSAGTP